MKIRSRQLNACGILLMLMSLSCHIYALSPAEAAEQARASTGGKVLQVRAQEEGKYRVKVLLPNGQVRTISISDSGSSNNQKSKKSKGR